MKVFGLIGNPVGHSHSPVLHETAYEEYGYDARYVTFEPAQENLNTALDGATALGIRGLNVTIPFKERVLDYVDPDSLTAQIGATNTIDFSNSPPTGHNTDASGAVRAFEYHDVRLDGARVLLVGAGGAGKAIAHGVTDAGAAVKIANRTPRRAQSLANSVVNATSHSLDEVPQIAPQCDIMINSTSVGMGEDKSVIPAECISQDHIVMDIVYHPVQTTLLESANQVGARTIDGGWMLLFQAAEAFEIWTGEPAPVEAMNHELRERL
jgi:shikimate dehydrogenase